MKIHQYRCELWLPKPRDEVFAFFADAGNLEMLTPPWLRFQILTPCPVSMQPGTLIDYRLRVRGLPLRWQSEITVWEPPFRFVDEQRRGPYRLWHHEHIFEEHHGRTLCRDTVRYAVPFDFLTHRLLIRPDIRAIFEFRQQTMRKLFEAPALTASPAPCSSNDY